MQAYLDLPWGIFAWCLWSVASFLALFLMLGYSVLFASLPLIDTTVAPYLYDIVGWIMRHMPRKHLFEPPQAYIEFLKLRKDSI